MKTIEKIKRFLSSGYFNPVLVFVLSLIGGLGFALFPFQDLSLEYMSEDYVLALWAEAMGAIFIVVTWVMLVSYLLDKNNGWHTRFVRRILLQSLYGGIVPLFFLLAAVGVMYGKGLFRHENMQFVFAVYGLFLISVNRQGYVIYLLKRKGKVRQEMVEIKDALAQVKQDRDTIALEARTAERLWNDKLTLMADQVRSLSKENESQNKEIVQLMQQITVLREELAHQKTRADGLQNQLPKKVYEIKYSPSNIVLFYEDEIAGFVITESRNDKPLIELFSKDKRQVLTNEASLTSVHKKFVDMIRLTRRHVVARDQITGIIDNKDGSVKVMVDFVEEPIEVKKDKWKTIGAEIRHLLEDRNRHQGPSPDALGA